MNEWHSAMADLTIAAIASRVARSTSTVARISLMRSTPIYNLMTSVLAGVSVILFRELAVSPLTLTMGSKAPQLQERRDLYALESKALVFGDQDARDLTRELHGANDRHWLNRVGETGVAGYLASFLFVGFGGTVSRNLVRSSPLRLGYGAAMMVGQMLYNDFNRRLHLPGAHFHHSRTRISTSEQLEAEINQHLERHASLHSLHRQLDNERLRDEVIQVQNELSAVRRALALHSSAQR